MLSPNGHSAPDEARLEADFEMLRRRLGDVSALDPARSDPIFYFVFPCAAILTVRRLLPGWIARMQNEDGLHVQTISLSDMVWQLIDASGRWETWLEVESQFDLQDLKAAVLDVLCAHHGLARQVEQWVTAPRRNAVLFLTDVELLHPFCRSRVIETYLVNKVQVPIVFFYPGRRTGQHGLHFLEFYAEDPGYRSTIIGGLA